jgi:hypothetical protein
MPSLRECIPVGMTPGDGFICDNQTRMPRKTIVPKSTSEIGHTPLKSQFEPILRTMRNHRFGCGRANPHGMGLVFYREGPPDRAICRFKLSRRYEGPPRHAHGGVIATLLDEAMGKANKLADVVAMTRTMEYARGAPSAKAASIGLPAKSPRKMGKCWRGAMDSFSPWTETAC